MYLQSETNIIISGRASSGTSVTALFLSYLLNKKYIYAGGTLKYFATRLGYDPKSKDIISFEKKYGDKWDILWENYIAWKIGNSRNLLVDAKIAGFFADHQPWLFEIFVMPDLEARKKRAGGDKRTEDIVQRDQEHSTRWKRLFGIDILNESQIRENYDYILDNSSLTISQTVFQIYKVMREALGLKEIIALPEIEKLETVYQAKGKSFLIERIEQEGNIISTSEILDDWKVKFADQITKLPSEWVKIITDSSNA